MNTDDPTGVAEGFVQDHPEGGPPAKARSGCAVFVAIVASVLVAIPIVFQIRKLATACQSPNAGPPWWVRQHCSVDPSLVVSTIVICLVVIGVAVLGGAGGWIVAVRSHKQRRWPTVATGVVILMSVLYACAFFLTLYSIGRYGIGGP